MHEHSQIQVLPKNYQKHNTKNNNSNNKSNKCSKEQNNHNKNNNFNRITRENSFIVGQPNNKNKSNNIDFKAKRDKNMGMSRNDCQNNVQNCQYPLYAYGKSKTQISVARRNNNNNSTNNQLLKTSEIQVHHKQNNNNNNNIKSYTRSKTGIVVPDFNSKLYQPTVSSRNKNAKFLTPSSKIPEISHAFHAAKNLRLSLAPKIIQNHKQILAKNISAPNMKPRRRSIVSPEKNKDNQLMIPSEKPRPSSASVTSNFSCSDDSQQLDTRFQGLKLCTNQKQNVRIIRKKDSNSNDQKSLNDISGRSIETLRINGQRDLERFYDFDYDKPLGKGSYGTVYKIVEKANKKNLVKKRRSWAVKKIERAKAGSQMVTVLEREVDILKKISHPNIIHLEAVYQSSDYLYLVTELCAEGELKGYLNKKSRLSEDESRGIIKQLADALMYLHGLGIVHRDIKGWGGFSYFSTSNLLESKIYRLSVVYHLHLFQTS